MFKSSSIRFFVIMAFVSGCSGSGDQQSSPKALKANTIMNDIGTQKAVDLFNGYVLISQVSGPEDMEQSTEYRWADFLKAYSIMTTKGVGGEVFFRGGNIKQGMVNIAAFLAQSMQETIQYNACDENNWSIGLSGVPDYPASAACGQAGQDYQKYLCTAAQKHMECPINSQMVQMAKTNAQWGGAPPPLFCAPKSMTGDTTPRWSHTPECGPAGYNIIPTDMLSWIDANVKKEEQATCLAYEGQFSGQFTRTSCPADGCWNWTETVDTPGGKRYNNVEGCCWWGRGVIQTTGPCNFGKLNYYLAGREYLGASKTKHQHDPHAPYKDLDFCENPGIVCNGPAELKWIAGMLYWIQAVQGYASTSDPWDLKTILASDGDEIFADPAGEKAKAFLDATSGLVNRGCPHLSCSSGQVHAHVQRFNNFKVVMTILRHLYDEKNPRPAGEPAGVHTGNWWSKEVMCQNCASCAIRYAKAGPIQCVTWAADETSCKAASKVAAVWCQ
ncbi:MAG TPA: hypothetical protein PLP16_13385 [Smithellaceae bacterium]|nr:hypothetical protein [Smithellaceae bacterium]